MDCKAHIEHALSLGLADLDRGGKTLDVVANGPSACHFDPLDCGDVLAVNGALDLVDSPTFWVACDPQELVADFLECPPPNTTYLIASKCHPKVFRRLKHHKVRLWHINDNPIPDGHRTVPAAVSVTLCALMLAMRMGYRTIHVWGWDLCFDGEHHHATPSQLSSTPERLNVEVGEEPDSQWFESTATWCCEVEDAAKILPILKWAGVEVKIHGRSMLAAILPEYAADA